jgi:SAM-dependent methyltransferase
MSYPLLQDRGKLAAVNRLACVGAWETPSVLVPDEQRWNHNLHYHALIVGVVPAGCARALDVGCGEGTLTRRLRTLVPEVTGIDLHEESIGQAQSHPAAGDIKYLVGDVLSYPFEPGSFDLVTAVASLHHMEAPVALARFQDLLAPRGVLAVIGLARSKMPADVPLEVAGALTHRLHRLRKGYWEHPSPTVWPPPRDICRDAPGCRSRPTRCPLPPSPVVALQPGVDEASLTYVALARARR